MSIFVAKRANAGMHRLQGIITRAINPTFYNSKPENGIAAMSSAFQGRIDLARARRAKAMVPQGFYGSYTLEQMRNRPDLISCVTPERILKMNPLESLKFIYNTGSINWLLPLQIRAVVSQVRRIEIEKTNQTTWILSTLSVLRDRMAEVIERKGDDRQNLVLLRIELKVTLRNIFLKIRELEKHGKGKCMKGSSSISDVNLPSPGLISSSHLFNMLLNINEQMNNISELSELKRLQNTIREHSKCICGQIKMLEEEGVCLKGDLEFIINLVEKY